MKSKLDRIGSRLTSYSHVVTANIYNKLGFITLPYAAHFIPTWQCNLKCKMCNIWKKDKDAGAELSTAEMLKVIRQLKSLDVVKITGGEPFLREDLGILADEIKKAINPFIIQIVTNGVLTGRILEFAESFACDGFHFRVSIDGIGKTHDKIRGADGTFERAYSTLQGLVNLRKKNRFAIGINFNVTDETISDMEKVIKLCRDLKIGFYPGIPVTPFLENINFDKENQRAVRLSGKEVFWRQYKESMTEASNGLNLLERVFLKKVNDDIFAKLISLQPACKFRCRELRNLLYLFPNGDAVTCSLNHKRVGNLIEKTLREIWFGKEMISFRQKVDECPGCLQSAVEILSRLYCFIGRDKKPCSK